MKERGILFSAEMVRAILADRKAQTRRIVDPRQSASTTLVQIGGRGPIFDATIEHHRAQMMERCPYGVSGDRLWVRETWYDDLSPAPAPSERERHEDGSVEGIDYRATHDCSNYEAGCPCNPDGDGRRSEWRPSIFMPRWASRITLEVIGVRVERLQAISEDDAIAEGITRYDGRWFDGAPHAIKGTAKALPTAREAFASLWDHINGERAPWASNPWVWAVSFRRVQP